MAPIVEVEHLAKFFQIRTLRASTLKEMLLVNLWKSSEYRELRALDDVSFVLEPGRTLGIVGSNGSGKSTLLRILAGVTPPTSGCVAVRGRSGSLIDLAAGLQPELSGIENIFFNMSMLGLSRREIHRCLSAVVDFAELGHYIHSPVKYYSTGMLVRLAFSIAVHLDPDVLLVDEAFSVGDAYFQGKSLDFMRRLHRTHHTTILLVTHDLDLVEDMCDEILWLEKGRIRYGGPLVGGLDRIMMEHQRHAVEQEIMKFSPELLGLLVHGRFGTGDAVIRAVRFVDRNGTETCTFRTGERFCFELDYEVLRPIKGILCGLAIVREDGLNCTVVYSGEDLFGDGMPPRGTIRATLDPLDFLPGAYRFSAGLLQAGHPEVVYDTHVLLYRFRVIGDEVGLPADAAFHHKARFTVVPL